MTCKICADKTVLLFEKEVMNKYQVKYFKCTSCQFIQTEDPYWLNEAYENVITSLDIGLVARNIYLTTVVTSIIKAFFNKKADFLDYGGGYGLLVRMMRDVGFNFLREDKYCDNLFAKHFDLIDSKRNSEFELVTAFELFEHFVDPVKEIDAILKLSGSILFSTELQPSGDLQNWEYVAPETGQHISLYHIETLKRLADTHKLHLYSNNRNLHLLTKKKLNPISFKLLTRRKVATLYNFLTPSQESYLQKDYFMIKNKITKGVEM